MNIAKPTYGVLHSMGGGVAILEVDAVFFQVPERAIRYGDKDGLKLDPAAQVYKHFAPKTRKRMHTEKGGHDTKIKIPPEIAGKVIALYQEQQSAVQYQQ